MEFYVYLNGARRGPLSEERVRALLVDGLLVGSDLGSEQPDAGWKPLAEFRRFEIADNLTAPASEPPLPAVAPANDWNPPGPITSTRPTDAASEPVTAVSSLKPEALGPYARSTLAPNETPFYKTSLHWIVFARFAGLA